MKTTASLTLTLALLAAPVIGPAPPAAAAEPCGRAPLTARDRASANLDHVADAWGAFCDRGTVLWTIENVAVPSLDGRALRCGVLGGDAYAGLHCYREFLSEPDAGWFELGLSFRLQPATTCNNAGSPSVAQAVEFTMNKWLGGVRYEWALQWQNVNQVAGDGAPQWRWWDANRLEAERWVPFAPKIGQCLVGDRWYLLGLRGRIAGGQVRYDSFSIDGVEHALGVSAAPVATPGEPDRLAIAVQANLNSTATPYDVVVDQVSFRRGALTQTVGATWFSDGGAAKSGPSGSVVSAFATSTRPNRPYLLVTATGGDEFPCSVDPLDVNPMTRFSNSRGFIPPTSGRIIRPPGTYQVCFYEIGTGSGTHHVGLPVWFTVV